MTLTNTIPTAGLAELFPGIEVGLRLETGSHLFAFEPQAMPLALALEQMVLAAITRFTAPGRVLEFGTARGRTTLIFAANSPPAAEIHTLDLAEPNDYTRKCLGEDTESGRSFRASPHSAKIFPLFRIAPDELPAPLPGLKGTMDLIHIDADHGYAGVKADTLAAMEMASADATIIWHDFYSFPSYVDQDKERRGVYPWLNEFATNSGLTLRHIAGTYLVVTNRNWTPDMPGHTLQPGDTPSPFGERIVRLSDMGW
jgi:predicted O-methyltransferase YrrM